MRLLTNKTNKRRTATRWQWTSEGAFLLASEKSGRWKEQASSFSAFVRARAARLKVDQSALWRAMAGVRFYYDLAPVFAGWHVPPLKDLEATISAEIMELIERHSRVVSRKKTLKLIQGAFEGEIRRRALQDSWRAHQRLLATNRRGRRPAGQRIEPIPMKRQITSFALEVEAAVYLAGSPLDWLGVRPDISKVFVEPKVPLPISDNVGGYFRPDLVIVAQQTATSDAYLHGVEVVCEVKNLQKVNQLQAYKGAFDFFWVACYGDPTLNLEHLSRDIGCLSVSKGTVKVVRSAQRMSENMVRSGQLAARLLAASAK